MYLLWIRFQTDRPICCLWWWHEKRVSILYANRLCHSRLWSSLSTPANFSSNLTIQLNSSRPPRSISQVSEQFFSAFRNIVVQSEKRKIQNDFIHNTIYSRFVYTISVLSTASVPSACIRRHACVPILYMIDKNRLEPIQTINIHTCCCNTHPAWEHNAWLHIRIGWRTSAIYPGIHRTAANNLADRIWRTLRPGLDGWPAVWLHTVQQDVSDQIGNNTCDNRTLFRIWCSPKKHKSNAKKRILFDLDLCVRWSELVDWYAGYDGDTRCGSAFYMRTVYVVADYAACYRQKKLANLSWNSRLSDCFMTQSYWVIPRLVCTHVSNA